MISNSVLNTTVTFQKRTGTKSTTSGQMNYAWADAQVGVRARLDEATGRLYPQMMGAAVVADHILFVNRAAVQCRLNEQEFRAVIGGLNYKILLISDAGGAQQHYEIALQRIY